MFSRRQRHLITAVALLLTTACNHVTQDPEVRLLKPADLSQAELRYGVAPVPDKATVYQPDVVLVGGGAAAIRGQSGNGFQWTIDANAPHASELVAGKVFFMTGLAVGRVLDVRRDGDSLQVTVGPVELTDILKEADLHARAVPVDLGAVVMHGASEIWGNAEAIATLAPLAPALTPAMYQPASPDTAPAEPYGSYKDLGSTMMNFKALPFVKGNQVGMSISKSADGLTVSAEAALIVEKPKIDADVVVQDGKLVTAKVTLEGAAGLSWNFSAGTALGRSANVRAFIDSPVDIYIPIVVIHGFPVSATIRQTFEIKTAFGVRNSTLDASGVYSFHGNYEVGYINGKWAPPQGPSSFHSSHTFLKNSNGLSIAVSAINFAHSLHLIVGVGAYGFAVGPYLNMTSAVALTRGSDIGMIECKEADFVVSVGGGVGYFLPKTIVAAINSFLAALNIKYRLKSEHAIQPSQSITLYNSPEYLSGCGRASSS